MAPIQLQIFLGGKKNNKYLKPLFSDSPSTAYSKSILQVANQEIVLKWFVPL